MKQLLAFLLVTPFLLFITANTIGAAETPTLKRPTPVKPVYESIPTGVKSGTIVFKFSEGMDRPAFNGRSFERSGPQWDRLNGVVAPAAKSAREVSPYFSLPVSTLDQMRTAGAARVDEPLPDLTLYQQLKLPANASAQEKLAAVRDLNDLDIIEVAYFEPEPSLAGYMGMPRLSLYETNLTPNWQHQQYYLNPAPDGVDAYYAWNFPGGKGDGVKVVDIEGNWIETHEDLKGGTQNFHIAGSRINDPGWWNHGTAVLGEIAADSNSFGMTGISFNVDLGTVSVGSMSTADALSIATANTDTGDVILIELHAPGPHYDFETVSGQQGYVAMEYWQANFDAIVQASALGRIVVEAAGNGSENYDDTGIYGSLFDPSYRFSGAIMVGATDADHVPAGFSNYGQRVDVHGFGAWDVYTLGYGGLYGSTVDNYYTGSFSGTSSASPIIVGAAACLQGIHKNTHGRILYHDGMRSLMVDYGTPQAPHSRHVGPLPNLGAAVDQVVGVSFVADTTVGWVPFDVAFSGSSGLEVDSWTWDFGDGDTAYVQSPTHTYATPGMHNVTLEILSDGETRLAQRNAFILALADTLAAANADGLPNGTVEIEIRARNTVPLTMIKLPIEYGGDLELTYEATSVEGCRTESFEGVSLIHQDPGNKRITVKLEAGTSGAVGPLQPGEGPILKLTLRVAGSAVYGQFSDVHVDGYLAQNPYFDGTVFDYNPAPVAATIGVCLERGNIDGAVGITVGDLTAMVDYLFRSGPAPTPTELAADLDCGGTVNVTDLTYFVDYLFRGGPEPCGC